MENVINVASRNNAILDPIIIYDDMPYSDSGVIDTPKKGKRKVQGVPQSQTAALPRHQEEEETDKTKQAQIEQTYEKHLD